jgi:hypothetical protein
VIGKFPVAMIPFTSLLYLWEKVGDKLDPYICRLVAHHSPIEEPKPANPLPWMTVRRAESLYISVHYHWKKHKGVPFDLGTTCRVIEEAGGVDAWIDEIGLKTEVGRPDFYVNLFKNQPATPGSEVEKRVVAEFSNWLKHRKIQGIPLQVKPNRHLVFAKAFSPLTGAVLDRFTVYTVDYIRGLNRATYGVVWGKWMEQTADLKLRDLTVIETF